MPRRRPTAQDLLNRWRLNDAASLAAAAPCFPPDLRPEVEAIARTGNARLGAVQAPAPWSAVPYLVTALDDRAEGGPLDLWGSLCWRARLPQVNIRLLDQVAVLTVSVGACRGWFAQADQDALAAKLGELAEPFPRRPVVFDLLAEAVTVHRYPQDVAEQAAAAILAFVRDAGAAAAERPAA